MTPEEEMEQRIKSLRFTTRGELDERILADGAAALSRGALSEAGARKLGRSKWFLMSQATRAVAAAGVLLTLLLAYAYVAWLNSPLVALAQVAANMKRQPWLRQVSAGTGAAFPQESWLAFEKKIYAARSTSGAVVYFDFGRGRKSAFDPESRRVTISPLSKEELPLDTRSPVTMLESMLRTLADKGATVSETSGEYLGKAVRVHEVVLRRDGADHRLTFFVDPEGSLLAGARVKWIDSSGEVILDGECRFSYPEQGPQDIYDLGVPRSAEVVSRLPPPELDEVLDTYQAARDSWPGRYIAVITGSRRHTAEFLYRDGELLRTDEVTNPSGQPENLSDSFGSLLDWWRDHPESKLVRIRLFDGRGDHSWSDRFGRTVYRSPRGPGRDPDHKGVEAIGWPDIRRWMAPGRVLKIVEDAYSRERGLLCLELRFPGVRRSGGVVSWPARHLYYLDPKRSFLCVKNVDERDPALDEDPSWRDAANPWAVPKPSRRVSEITDFGRTPAGLWYPTRITVEWAADTSEGRSRISTRSISVEFNPTFRAGLFDASDLPD